MTRKSIAPQQEHVNNIMTCYGECTEEELTLGTMWYPAYADFVASYGAPRGINRAQAIALFAVLSQRSSLKRNVDLFKVVCNTRDALTARGAFPAQKEKLARILHDAVNPSQYAVGPKISVFHAALSGDASAVCTDRHVWSICTGNTFIDGVTSIATSEHDYVAACYRTCAAIIDVEPRILQAATWVTHRRLKGVKDMHMHNLEEEFEDMAANLVLLKKLRSNLR